MTNRLLADAVLILHLAFVVFVVIGGFLALKWPRIAWIHVPCAVWGSFVELTGRICPLTPLENTLRRRAGLAGYEGDFIEHYVVSLIYPRGLTAEVQLVLGVFAIAINVLAYGLLARRRFRQPA